MSAADPMIKVNRASVEIPDCLRIDVDSAGSKESTAANAHFERRLRSNKLEPGTTGFSDSVDSDKTAKGAEKKSFTFKAYKGAKSVLRELFANKCGYCEIEYGGAPSDVEHFRPKARIDYVLDGRKMSYIPGYYWLAADWDNLIYSCQHCNRRELHEHQVHQDSPAKKRTSGKGNLFPLSEEGRRLTARQAVTQEEPYRLLLDPCRDDPNLHLRFHCDGFVTAREEGDGLSLKGKTSIRVYGLDRVDLRDRRKAIATQLLYVVKRLNDDLRDLEETSSVRARQYALDAMSHINKNFLNTDRPFLAMSRAIFGQHVDRARLPLLETPPE